MNNPASDSKKAFTTLASVPLLGRYFSSRTGRAALSYFLALLIVALFFVAILFSGQYYAIELKLVFLLAAVSVWWRVNSVVLLFMTLVYLVVNEPSGASWIATMVVPTFGILLIVLADRFRVLRGFSDQMDPPDRNKEPPETAGQIPLDWSRTWPLFRLGIAAVFCVMLSATMLAFVPLNQNASHRAGLLQTELRMIMICFILMVCFLAAATAISHWGWRRLSSAQASLYLRSVLASWLEPDWRRVIRRRLKRR